MKYQLVEAIPESAGPVWIFDLDTLFDADHHVACPVGECHRAFFLIEAEPEGGDS